MTKSQTLAKIGRIQRQILLIRGEKVIIDRDLANAFGITIRALNQATTHEAEEFNMNTRSFAFVAVFLVLVPTALRAQITLGESVTVSFASAAEGKQLLTSRDDFVERMSPFDRASRLKTDKDVSESQYLEFVGRNVLEWNDAETEMIRSALRGIQKSLEAMALPFPGKVLIIKTTGKEEGGAAYTRANAVILPQAALKGPASGVQKTICHEFFHILSRANPDLREKLYAAIGFETCNEIAFPPELESRKITNPDAPRNDHCILVKVDGKEQWVIPILFSSAEKYDVNRGGEFFNYLQFQLLLVERTDDASTVRPMADGRKTMLVGMQQVSGFFEQVGRNTGYIIHPEEILADNFALLVLKERNLASPEVIEKIRAILEEVKTAEPGAAENTDTLRRARRRNLDDRIETRLCGPSSLGIEDLAGRIDFALAFAIVHEVPDPSRLFTEIHTVLKSESRVLVAEPKGRVSVSQFERSTATAEACGFDRMGSPEISRTHAVILKRKRDSNQLNRDHLL